MLSKALAVFGLVPRRSLTRWLGISAVLLAVLGQAWPASAQYKERPNYLHFGGGLTGLMSDNTVLVWRPDWTVLSEASYTLGWVVSGTYGRFVHPQVVIEGEVAFIKNGINEFYIDQGVVSDQEYTATILGASALYHFYPVGNRWSPYAGGGFVFMADASLDLQAPFISGTLSGRGVGFQVKGGLQSPIRDGLHWNLEGRYIHTQELTLDNASASVDIDYRNFGGVFYLGYTF